MGVTTFWGSRLGSGLVREPGGMTIDRLGGPDKISAVRSDSLREQVTRALEAAVVAGELQPGEIYSAPTLAERFQVSATPVREAMLDLVGEGMMEAVRNRGFRVMEVSEADLDQISQIRLLIEVPIMSQVAKLLTPEKIAALNETGAGHRGGRRARRPDRLPGLRPALPRPAHLGHRQPAADRPGRPAAPSGPAVRAAGAGRQRPAAGLGPRAPDDGEGAAVRRRAPRPSR